jgi:hypothetical protein
MLVVTFDCQLLGDGSSVVIRFKVFKFFFYGGRWFETYCGALPQQICLFPRT